MFEKITRNSRYWYARFSSKSQKQNSSLEGRKAEFFRLDDLEKIFGWKSNLLLITFKIDFIKSSSIAIIRFTLLQTFENKWRKQQQHQGIKADRKTLKYFGWRTVIDKKLINQVHHLKENKNLSITQIAKLTGPGQTTIYKALKNEVNYIPDNLWFKNDKDY